jgi:hypothetical protein
VSWWREATSIRTDRRFRFELAPDELWEQITDIGRYREWWSWLRELRARDFAEGEVWRAKVQPPAPYSVRFTLRLDEVVEHEHVSATITGDIQGRAALDVRAHTAGSEIPLVSDLAPRHPALRAMALVGKPLLRFGHDWVLDTGARQFDRNAVQAVQDQARRRR